MTEEQEDDIEKIIKEILIQYGEHYGMLCYSNGMDGKRELPSPEDFTEIFSRKLIKKLKKYGI